MGWFDAICHAFSALSLAGFSTRDASVGAFNSPAIEAVLIFMVIAALNFATHYTAWRDASVRPYWRDSEAKGGRGAPAAELYRLRGLSMDNGHLPELPDGTTPCQLQSRIHRCGLRIRQRRLCPVAHLRALLDAFPFLYHR